MGLRPELSFSRCGHRTSEEITLHSLTPKAFEVRELLTGFSTFCRHIKTKGIIHRDNRSDEGCRVRVLSEIHHKCAIDPHGIDRKTTYLTNMYRPNA